MLKIETSPDNFAMEMDGTVEDVTIDLFVAVMSVLARLFPSAEQYEKGKDLMLHMLSNSSYEDYAAMQRGDELSK